ncbi:MAG: hypothetical protein GX616_10740 [Planctomycetes bacterium]|nr:hypothetical protein [Planctomycetota bacterium]
MGSLAHRLWSIPLLFVAVAAVRAEGLPPGYVQGDVVSYSYVPIKSWTREEGIGVVPYLCEYGLMKMDDHYPLTDFHAENIRRIDIAGQWSTAIMLYARRNSWHDEIINLMIRCHSKRQLIVLRNYWKPGEANPFQNALNILTTLWTNRDTVLTNPEGDQATGRQIINNILMIKAGDEGECGLRTDGLQTIYATFDSVIRNRVMNGQQPFSHIHCWYNMLHYSLGCHASSQSDVDDYGRFLLPANTQWIGVDTYHYWTGTDPLTMTSTQRRRIADAWQNIITRYHPEGLTVSPCGTWNTECQNDTHALFNGLPAAGAHQTMMIYIANSDRVPGYSHTTPIESMDAFYDSIKAGPWVGLVWWVFANDHDGARTLDYVDKTLVDFDGNPYTPEQLDDFHDRFIASRMRMFNDVVHNQFGHLNPLAPVIADVSPDPESVLVGAAYGRQMTLQAGTAPYTWLLVAGPAGLNVDANGCVSGWIPDASQTNQTITITVRVSNTAGSDETTWQVRVEPLPPGVVAFFPFNADAQGWTLEGWRSGSFDLGTMDWVSAQGVPAGHVHSAGTGLTNNDNNCTREGGLMTRTVPTVGFDNIRVEYQVMADLDAPPDAGCTGSCGSKLVEGSCEDKLAVYYSTAGAGGPWTLAEVLTEGSDLPSVWTRRIIDLATVPAAANNPDFSLRFKWQFNTEYDAGHLDNIIVRSTSSDINAAPQVDAGPDQVAVLPASVDLDGTVIDDYLPDPPRQVTVIWSKESGPDVVTFANPQAVDTTASFSSAGRYVLRLAANDSALSGSDTVTVTVRLSTGELPDFDADDDVDMEDFGRFQACFSGSAAPHGPGCEKADLDNDGDVDRSDFGVFLDCLGGPESLPGC